MFPVSLEATGMDSGEEHKGNWHPPDICISFVAVRGSAREHSICEVGGHAGETGNSGFQTTLEELRGKGEGRAAKVGGLRVDDWVG